jgi:hypothetical protein
MNNFAKLALLIVAAIVAYFLFFADSFPSEIEYRGNTLGIKQEVENNSAKKFKILTYSDKTNYHILLILIPEEESVTTQELLEFYVRRFEGQGYKYRKDGNMHLGLKGDEVIYMTIAAKMNAAVAYIEKAPESLPGKPSDANDVFSSLADLSL